MRALAIALLGLAAFAGAAQASTTVLTFDGRSAAREQRVIDHSRMPSPTATVTVRRYVSTDESLDNACGSIDGCSMHYLMWLARDTAIPWREVLLHELGHQTDYLSMTDAARRAFAALVPSARGPWVTTPNSPHEQFAEAYRACSMFTLAQAKRSGPFDATYYSGDYGLRLSWRAYERVCSLIARTVRSGTHVVELSPGTAGLLAGVLG